jgi:hypothetical protein
MKTERKVSFVDCFLGEGTMQHQDDTNKRSRPSTTAPSAVSISSRTQNTQDTRTNPIDHVSVNHHCRHTLMPKQLLNSEELCSRFEQISGKGMPKRMTTGKFVYLGPTDRLPDSPL